MSEYLAFPSPHEMAWSPQARKLTAWSPSARFAWTSAPGNSPVALHRKKCGGALPDLAGDEGAVGTGATEGTECDLGRVVELGASSEAGDGGAGTTAEVAVDSELSGGGDADADGDADGGFMRDTSAKAKPPSASVATIATMIKGARAEA